MKRYICDMCETVITDPHSVKMTEFCFTFSNFDIYQVPEEDKIKTKIHLCGDCIERFKAIAKYKTLGKSVKPGKVKRW